MASPAGPERGSVLRRLSSKFNTLKDKAAPLEGSQESISSLVSLTASGEVDQSLSSSVRRRNRRGTSSFEQTGWLRGGGGLGGDSSEEPTSRLGARRLSVTSNRLAFVSSHTRAVLLSSGQAKSDDEGVTSTIEQLPRPVQESYTGVLCIADVSGYSKLSVQLSSQGSHGAELLTTSINSNFFKFFIDAVRDGQGEVVKFVGGLWSCPFSVLGRHISRWLTGSKMLPH
jgi:hypothetical protein